MHNNSRSLLVIIVLFVLSAIGAFLLFRLLESWVTIKGTWYEAGGAVAGFMILFWRLDRSFCRIRRIQDPSLTGEQTLDIIHLFQENVKYLLLRSAFRWIDELEAGQTIPSVEERLTILDHLRHEPRQYVTGFSTPFPNLYKHMEKKSDLPVYREAVIQGVKMIDSDDPPKVKRERLLELADSVQSEIYNTYVDDLRRKNAL